MKKTRFLARFILEGTLTVPNILMCGAFERKEYDFSELKVNYIHMILPLKIVKFTTEF